MNPYIYSPDSLYSSDDTYSPHQHYPSKRRSPSTVSSRFHSWSAYNHISTFLSAPHHLPKVTNLTAQPSLSYHGYTPSSASTQSIQTPSSPFIHEYPDMDYDESDDDDDDSDSEVMDGIEEEASQFYSVNIPQVVKSTSALEGALGNGSRSSGLSRPQPPSTHVLSDRRISVSAPGYPTSSHRTIPSHAHPQRRPDRDMYSQRPYKFSSPASRSYPHHNHNSAHTHEIKSSTSAPFAPASKLYQHSSSPSLGDAISPGLTPGSTPVPILHPQPIRLIPPIPLDDLASSAAGVDESVYPNEAVHEPRERSLPPAPLLYQPVSDAVRYQLSIAQDDGQSYNHRIMTDSSLKPPVIQTDHFISSYPRNHLGFMHTQMCATKMSWR